MKNCVTKRQKKWTNLGLLVCFFIGAFLSTVCAEAPASSSPFWLQEKDAAAKVETPAAKEAPAMKEAPMAKDAPPAAAMRTVELDISGMT